MYTVGASEPEGTEELRLAHCIGCQTELLFIDKDNEGRLGPTCLRCLAEEKHDFDLYPDVKFDRFGDHRALGDLK